MKTQNRIIVALACLVAGWVVISTTTAPGRAQQQGRERQQTQSHIVAIVVAQEDYDGHHYTGQRVYYSSVSSNCPPVQNGMPLGEALARLMDAGLRIENANVPYGTYLLTN